MTRQFARRRNSTRTCSRVSIPIIRLGAPPDPIPCKTDVLSSVLAAPAIHKDVERADATIFELRDVHPTDVANADPRISSEVTAEVQAYRG